MSYRFTLAAVAAVLALTGCAKSKTADQAPAFDFGSTRVTVTHVPTKTDDGTKLYVTIDGKDAGALGIGESMELQLPEGKHKVGGYARSLVGRVTISPVEVATSRDAISHVTYSVANLKPTFLVRASTPVPKPKSESIPAEPVPSMPAQIEDPAAAEQTQTVAPAAPVTTQQTQTVTPAAPVTTPQTQTATPVTTQGTQTPNITELTPVTQSPASQATQDSAASVITDLTSSAPQT
ncbi:MULTISPECIES: hypothetical protein [Rahnella]|jgi:hypothetical protein|uniref:hypothetical protein n=1 Tax=Rahnella TaxID=34037 RepID=UPI000DD2F1A2|nr:MULTISPECIES: hypothetical protein [Rahnella]MBU9867262.1 hypothetical protein [Rahnella aceris]RKT75503.1 hypothetical protein BJ925_3558 [Rahnella aquatilis]